MEPQRRKEITDANGMNETSAMARQRAELYLLTCKNSIDAFPQKLQNEHLRQNVLEFLVKTYSLPISDASTLLKAIAPSTDPRKS